MRDPSRQRARRRALRRRKLRRDTGGAARIGIVRTPQRRIHRRRLRPQGSAAKRTRRNPVSGRNRRHAAVAAGEIVARAAGAPGAARGRDPDRRRGSAHHFRHAPQPGPARCRGPVSRGPVLPFERGRAEHSDTGPASRGHRAARAAFSEAGGDALPQAGHELRARSAGDLGRRTLARQCAATAKCGGTGGSARDQRHDPGIAGAKRAQRQVERIDLFGPGETWVRARLSGAHPEDHPRQRRARGKARAAQPH